ncbi:MAG TPA: MFS transporter [Patescibacteria group bacterium]|nr:MFS transporter [Patescibacteria group bacterium]
MKKQFVLSATLLALFIFTAGVPSPLYGIYQQQWHFSTLMLTIVFAIYALSFVVALLFMGRLSDCIGRRPVLIAVLVVEAISMLLFTFAGGVTMLIIARLLQGVATGIASATLSARLLDTQPADRPGLAGLTTTIVPVTSIGSGAFVASLFVSYMPWPTHLIFWIVAAIATVLVSALLLSHETNKRQRGWQQALMPKVLLPATAHPTLQTLGPSLIACWALIGFYLSLGPSIATTLLHDHGHLLGGILVFGLTAPGALCMYCFRKWDNSKLVTTGNILACLGLMVTVFGMLISSPILFLAGTILAGTGFGPAFMGSFKSIMAHATPNNRAGLASAVYIISYIAFGLPAVIAGLFLNLFSLQAVGLVYTSAVFLLYIFTLFVKYGRDTASIG